MFEEYQIVRLKRAMDGVAEGALGTVLMVYPGVPVGYEVEFCDDRGCTLALLTLHDGDLVLAPGAERDS